MKARLPKNYGGQGIGNMQQLARQAQKMQDEMEAKTAELEQKEYTATAGGGAVKAVVSGAMEVKSLEIDPEIVDPEDVEMLSDTIIGAINEAIRNAAKEKEDSLSAISGGLNIPGII